ncbi:glycoside hydrolase family 43 protein [Sphingomonas sp. HF-S4]|uniref:Glycoside hydrolase family 43 protein n=1 Tax=Sphingomonas agrestis TaxID=3080540 RepID=A0ABU3YDA3_9SPHN|nr:glycoside hydrolase family 43 protein [Sphingomonas sp. HF-S4]MDV3459376.1 glycoside hydrolase family 43 protein [Sphingomonas sp. HF-S4]
MLKALIAALAVSLAIPAAAQPKADPAPLLLPQMQLHDPFIVADKATKTYYLFTRNETAMTGDRRLGTMVYTSKDLKHWTRPRVVFALPEGTWAKNGAWAPEVHPWKGKWYLFTTFHNEAAALPSPGTRKLYRRGTILAVADKVDGPYRVVRGGEPIVDKALMTLDGTLHVDAKGKPWLVYAHEWLQTTVGTIEAIPLNDDLSAAGKPRVLFRADEAPWARGQRQADGDTVFVTDGPEFHRTSTGTLVMLWSSYGERGYVQSIARSKSGSLDGPWEQLDPLVRRDSGHGMLFRAFDGRLMMVLHRPFTLALGKLYEMRDSGDRVEVVREATELDLEAYPTHPCVQPHTPTERKLEC